MKSGILLIALIAASFCFDLQAQKRVTRNDTVKVFHGTTELMLPWASGLNAAHISEFDFNQDNKMDLFVFEPSNEINDFIGNKVMPFINVGGPNQSVYKYAPKYRNYFPMLRSFALLKDYNCDNRPDIFTVNNFQGITVWRNDGGPNPSFTRVKETLRSDTSDLPPNFLFTNDIYWNEEDLPTFTDVDNDGDMDILTVDRFGYYVEYHKNRSKEKYGNCDSLDFVFKNTCWGRIAEDAGIITLDTCHPYGNVTDPEFKGKGRITPPAGQKGAKHSSTSLLALDLNGDNVKDLIVGDGILTGLFSYVNGGATDSSKITSYTTSYPPSNPASLVQFPIPTYVETNNDNKKDLIVSVRYDFFQDVNSVWRYINTGSTNNPNFVLDTKSFLQEDMIDVGTRSYPVFFDYDGDSLLDIVVGNLGLFQSLGILYNNYHSSLTVYRNTGELQAPEFELETTDMNGIANIIFDTINNTDPTGLHPAFGDLDYDGDQDMILGDFQGKIHYFRNDPINGKANFTLVNKSLQGIDVGMGAAPFLYDFDEDGRLDLFIGSDTGHVKYYKNETLTNLEFTLADPNFGNISVTSFFAGGYCVPFLFKDSLGDLKMLLGVRNGEVNYYDSIVVNGNLRTKFNLVEKSYQNIWDGYFASIHGADLNNDNSLDFVLGNQSGGLTLYTSEDSLYIPGVGELNGTAPYLQLFPNPTAGDLNVEVNGAQHEDFRYVIRDLLGHKVFEIRDKGKTTISTTSLVQGMYILQAENKNRSIVLTERFILSK